MRQGQNPKRSRGRSSGRRNNVPARHQTFDSNGPSVRIRGSAFQVHEKYLAMARDAAAAGDRIAAENYSQHAEHYFRIINADSDGDGRGRVQAQQAARQQQEDQIDGDYEASSEEGAVVEAKTPKPGNGADTGETAGDGEQPTVEFPDGEGPAASGAAGEEARQRKPRVSRTPRTPRTPRGRGPRTAVKSDGDETPPTPSEE